MAGDWIKWTVGLAQKREVLAMAKHLGLERRLIAGALMELWEWCDSNTEDGTIAGLGPEIIDNIVQIKGFGEAMGIVGWLLTDDSGLIIPNFERHNGNSAKRRALDAERKRRVRSSSA